ncbi:Ni/Fe-hydrogenase cytochrome b subunit [Serratia fonticola]|jgi:Ni/Fe-hydrogenase subunit HybB-like protein|uniref:Ni/Fe-hydrogenase cytochrome b subunit n=2 Tax=Serratia fonticola TaxID=47917 RepID=A0A0F7HE87_SERFO|nr:MULTISPECIES: Ni/Fe-hydrogenase cytochrome b subunit [Serratia]ERK16052.1 Ni/Fe-hydrogenase 2 B-type cytochrome subunit [Serratia fonticola AU-AP2C]AKG71006.1 hydrogenase 2 b cytochrome subunit [Serratia fonticola]ALX94607.1 hydrogenase 2 b cytochrome subunit [Serratia fonticola]AYM89906.1 Ni/Fe-hydrogenase cytochrome b subunit [Serratia sp. 3ACOL1]MBC3228555.1 Ni/Fe-hydrogenase cytochrome b subunit [Serratia fonticola]
MTTHKTQPLGGRLVSWPVMMLAPFVVLCLLLILKRLVLGLGDVSDLNGGYPWGIWIAFDLLVGTGLACGGWALAWAVYVFNRGEYHPLVRPALLASLFGYSLGGLSITIDVGRYWNLPYFYIPGHFNTSSVLFETAVCMTIYVGIVALEFAPALLERLGWKVSLKRLNKVMFLVIALGALLPTMHQSSMGSLMIAAGIKIHPLWQSYEMLPLFSLLTAGILGFSIVIFEGSLVQAGLRGKGPEETPLFARMTYIIDGFLLLFIVLRFGELIWRGKTDYLWHLDRFAISFWVETLLMLVPLVMFRWKRNRRNSRLLFLGALSMVCGASFWRLNYALLAYDPGNGYHYFPTASELLISIGFVAIEVCAYILLIRLLPVLPAHQHKNENNQLEVEHEPTHHH